MNKWDVVRYVSRCANVNISQALRCINCYHDAISGAIKDGDRVSMRGFGSYSIALREAIKIIKFKPGKDLKKALE